MKLTWTKENSPRWDADKQRVFGPAELAAVGLPQPAPGHRQPAGGSSFLPCGAGDGDEFFRYIVVGSETRLGCPA